MAIDYQSGMVAEALDAVVQQIKLTTRVIEFGTVTGHLFDLEASTAEEGVAVMGASKAQLRQAVSDIYVPGTNEPGTSNVSRYPGFFSVDPTITAAIKELNNCKANLRTVSATAKANGMTWRHFRATYAASGYGHLHALQLTREFVIVPGDTRALGFTVTGSIRSMQNMTMEECIEWLDKAGANDIISTLYQRGYSDQATLRVNRPVAAHVRVNIFPKDGSVTQHNSSLPVIIDAPDWEGRVNFRRPSTRSAKRSDTKTFQDSIPLPFINKGYLEVTDQSA